MIAQPSELNDERSRRSARTSRQTVFRARLTPYELSVIASQVDDVVRSAGGWLFDRVMAGWGVNVLVPDDCDVRPLQILGVKVVPFESGFESVIHSARTESLAVAADVFRTDARVRENVAMALQRGHIEVAFWGGSVATDLGHGVHNVAHRLSAAAQAFKTQALVAAGVPHVLMGSTESFLRCGCWSAPDDSDLKPVS
jgi:hypothetical protein